MSIVAEFARELNDSCPVEQARGFTPLYYPARFEMLHDIKAVIFDVYGTLVNYWRPEFSSAEGKATALLAAFEKTVERFHMGEALLRMNPGASPGQTLRDFYHGLISLSHQESARDSNSFPEVKIERIWHAIALMLKRNGYVFTAEGGDENEFARCVAYFYNFHALGRGFYPGVTDALLKLRLSNMHLGIVSNAQFYTPIDLSLFVRAQSSNLDDYSELFDIDLTFFSYEYGVAKPGQVLFRRLYDALYEYHILPAQTVYVGNDLVSDIEPAAAAGMRTAFFCGDAGSAFVHGSEGEIVPDISFVRWDELPGRLSFYEDRADSSRMEAQ